MEGIEILATGEIGVEFAFNWAAAIIGGLIAGSIVSFIVVLINDEDIGVSLIVFPIVSVIIGLAMGEAFQTPTTTVPTYKITIDDTVSLNEFYNRYEILEQDGKIFTVKERKE